MNLTRLLVPMALLPVVASAQTTVFSSDFSTGSLITASGVSAGVGDWILASTKNTNSATGANSTSPSYATGAFGFGMLGTTSGVVETQSRFTSAANAVTLSNINDYIELRVGFTSTTNLLTGNGGTNVLNSTINVGLFDSGGSSPGGGLQGSGLTATTGNATFGSGFVQHWEGYAARIGTNNGSSSINQIMTRPTQNVNTASANQDLLFMGVGGGTYGQNTTVGVPGVAVAQEASTVTAGTLANGTAYSLTYRITLSAADQYLISYALGNADGSTIYDTVTGTTSLSSFISGLQFDGVAIGYRSAQATTAPGGGTNINTGITLNSVQVLSFSAVPEPSAFAALAGAACLAFAASRRRRSA